MRKDNEIITLSGEEAIAVLAEIEYILISLRNIAKYYYHNDPSASIDHDRRLEYCAETTRFLDQNRALHRLAHARGILSKKFNDALGADEMDDIEREMEKIKYWERPGD